MIKFGPAGIPLSCKGRTLRDGIIDVHSLGLTALEYQLLRVNVVERAPYDDEIGKPLSEVGEFVVEIKRKEKNGVSLISDMDEKIKKKDMLSILLTGPTRSAGDLRELNKLAKSLDVSLSVHVPYYIDLCVSQEIIERSIYYMKLAGIIAKELDAKIVVTHIGPYNEKIGKKRSIDRAAKRIAEVVKWYSGHGIKAKLGLEPSGREDVIGTMDEIFSLCKKVRGTQPVLNIPHIHARTGGLMNDKGEVYQILEKAKKFSPELYIVFSGVIVEGKNEVKLTPVKSGNLKFEPLAECLIDNNYDATIISTSPLLEHDAMYLKIMYERVFAKKVPKIKEKLERKDLTQKEKKKKIQ
ncbi:MAG: sugar phosphate isomerase/epimerase family protein, partial [Thermoplasmata archaeon]